MSESPKDQFTALIAKGGKVNEADVEAIFNELPAAPIDLIHGDWKGAGFDTSHPCWPELLEMNWFGKTFHSTENIDPVIVLKDGKPVKDESWGHAILREVRFRGIVSAAMIYDNHRIIDHFRYVNDNLIAGAMETTKFGDGGMFYFYLYK
ncbi:uncharacterized protein N7500_009298 [Penicillium coprophilum]|uniref:uncharacterized protein n=1 Tax=Penicillium coprophilum TaxID=36646 RepID=UPI002392CCA8|nr:uncharacterized protein N7500_009298 [Penicillium coprophilum]KAJ5153859.1 hypothetical protein N7500_009298 [Penicillium coprophilum]